MTCNKVRRPVNIEIKTCSNICACHDDRISRAKLYPKETGIIFNKSGIIYQRNSSHSQEKNSVRSLLTSLIFLGLCALTIRTADVLKNSHFDKTARSRRQSSVWVFHALTVKETVSLLSAFQNEQQLACPTLAPSTTSPPPTQPHRKDQGPHPGPLPPFCSTRLGPAVPDLRPYLLYCCSRSASLTPVRKPFICSPSTVTNPYLCIEVWELTPSLQRAQFPRQT